MENIEDRLRRIEDALVEIAKDLSRVIGGAVFNRPAVSAVMSRETAVADHLLERRDDTDAEPEPAVHRPGRPRKEES